MQSYIRSQRRNQSMADARAASSGPAPGPRPTSKSAAVRTRARSSSADRSAPSSYASPRSDYTSPRGAPPRGASYNIKFSDGGKSSDGMDWGGMRVVDSPSLPNFDPKGVYSPASPAVPPLKLSARGSALRSMSEDGPRSVSDMAGRDGPLANSMQKQDKAREKAAASWWLTEVKRMRDEALKMRAERDRFREAVEDAHAECRRLTRHSMELQTQLKQTQTNLRASAKQVAGAGQELERLRKWIEETHAESGRLSVEVTEYDWKLRETSRTLDAAERSCRDLKAEIEIKDSELVLLRSQVFETQNTDTRKENNRLRGNLEEAKERARIAQRDLLVVQTKLDEERMLAIARPPLPQSVYNAAGDKIAESRQVPVPDTTSSTGSLRSNNDNDSPCLDRWSSWN